MVIFQLRKYQEEAIDAAIAFDGERGIIDLPTGSGKSIVIAEIAQKLPGRVLILAHRKELLEQNGSKFSENVGYYSAGLGSKDYDKRITIAGIQSVFSNLPKDIQWILIDECHRVPNIEKGMYWTVINKLYPAAVIGLTATPYRLDDGKLQWGNIIYKEYYKPLLEQNYLTPLINKVPFVPYFEAKVQGDYVLSELEKEMIDPTLLDASVKKIVQYSHDRKSVLIFVTTVKHGQVLQKLLELNAINSVFACGNTPKEERSEIVKHFRAGRLRYVINCNLWTEGFDAPCVDMIAILRPTKSKCLHEQILGRGVRKFDGKENCLILDMAGNLNEHGGLGTPYKGKKTKKEVKEDPEGKICPECEEYVDREYEQCPSCGYEWPKPKPRTVKHDYEPDTVNPTVFDPKSFINDFMVKDVTYMPYTSTKGNLMLKAIYHIGDNYNRIFYDYILAYHPNDWARDKAWKFFQKRGITLDLPIQTYEVNYLAELAKGLKKPIKIRVDETEQFPKIIGYEYEKSGTSNPKGTNSLVELLGGDEIVY